MNNPIKVAICSWCYGIAGGAARMETYYHQFYNRELFDPHIVSLVQRPESGPEYDKTIPFIQVNQKDRFSHLLAILADFDVIQFQGGFNPLVCEASKYTKKPHVLLEVLHNIEPGGMYPEIDGTICVSNAVASKQSPQINHKTILNGINLELFQFSPKKESVPDKIILLQVARRSKMAINLDELSTELFAINPKLELWIVGDCALESTDKVKFFGCREDIAELYKRAHFTVLLSSEEPFGLVAVESMASGTPVILSNSGGFLDIVTDPSLGFLVDGPTKDNAVSVIRRALDTLGTERYQQLCHNGRIQAEKNFSIRQCIRHYEDYILELYQTKKNQENPVKTMACIPPHALVCEALLDKHANDLEMMALRLRNLSCLPHCIENQAVLATANGLSLYLKEHRPDLLPRLLSLYLYRSGDRSEDICQEILKDFEFFKQQGIT